MNNQYLTLAHWLTEGYSPISIHELAILMAEPGVHHLFIKDKDFKYVYANTPFVTLMGLKHINQLLGHKDCGLCSDNSLIERYRMYDSLVLEKEKVLPLLDEVRPKHNGNFSNTMEGKEYPLNGKAMNVTCIQSVRLGD